MASGPSGGDSPSGGGAAARPDVTILSSGHDVADARLHRHCAALRRAGLSVEVMARGSAADAPEHAGFRVATSRGIAGRGIQALTLPGRARGRVVVTLDPDLVPAARFRRVYSRGFRLAVDVHEDYVALLADRAWARGAVGVIAKAWARTAVALSRGADLTVVADEHVPPLAAANRLVVRNLPDLTHLPQPSDPDPAPRALYIGDVRESRGLFAMLRTIELAPDWQLDIVGPVAARDQARLSEWQASSEAASRLRLHGRMPPQQAWKLASGAWAGMSLLSSTPAFESAIPSKVYEYLACGLPVLSTPIRRAAELVEQAGAGAVVADPEAAAATLNAWSSNDREGFELRRKAAAEWSERFLAEPNPYDVFAGAIADLVAQTRPAVNSTVN
jgi:glycosyltransferase involved in cell wall biosynthesis